MNDGDFLLPKQVKLDSAEKLWRSSFNFFMLLIKGCWGHSTHAYNACLRKRLALFSKMYSDFCKLKNPMSKAARLICRTGPDFLFVCNRRIVKNVDEKRVRTPSKMVLTAIQKDVAFEVDLWSKCQVCTWCFDHNNT